MQNLPSIRTQSAGGIETPLREEYAIPTSVYPDPIVPLKFSFAKRGSGGGGSGGGGSRGGGSGGGGGGNKGPRGRKGSSEVGTRDQHNARRESERMSGNPEPQR